MGKEPPFDAWDGEDLETVEVVLDDAAEEVAMHLEPEDELRSRSSWSDLTDGFGRDGKDDGPVCYFDDEQPERDAVRLAGDDGPEPDLEQLLERQHYAFPPGD